MWLWLSIRMVQDLIRRTFKEPFGSLILFPVVGLALASMVFIIIARNHYGVDVFLGAFLIELVWQSYGLAARGQPRDSPDSAIVKFVRWLETRHYPLSDAP
jgi:hypothetical protein